MDDVTDFLSDVRDKFERAAEAENDNRVNGLDDIEFARLGKQWDEGVRKLRELDHRPCLTFNKMPTFIRQVVNDARQNRPSITVHPADSKADVETAKILSGIIRHIEVSSNADIAYDTAIEAAVGGGFGYWRVNTAYTSDDSFDQDITIERIADAFTVFGDPDSDSADGSDWNCAFIVKTLTKEEFGKRYKGKDAVDWDALGYTGLASPWMDGDDIMVAEYWHREQTEKQIVALTNGMTVEIGELDDVQDADPTIEVIGEPRTVKGYKVTQYILSGAEVLEEVEWPGKYIPIIPVYGDEVIIEGKRHLRSLIRDAKDAQRDYNYWRTTTTEMVALAPKAPFIGPVGAFDTDVEKWSTANNMSHAYIEYDGTQAPQRQSYQGPPAAAIQQALSANDDMKAIIGLHDASLGMRSNETSGIAIRERQRQGNVATFHFLDNLTRAIRHCGNVLLDLIPQVFGTARVARILGDDMRPEAVQLAPADQQQALQQQMAMRGQQIARIYDITAGKYDLTVKAGPSYSTMREETRAELVEIIRAVPAAAEILGPMYLRNSDWPGADEAADKLEQGEGGSPPQQDPRVAQMMQQMQQTMQKMQQLEAENAAMKADRTLEQQKMLYVDIPKAEADKTKAQADLIRANKEGMMPAPNPYGLG